MNIAQATEEIKNTVRAYTMKKEDGTYRIPAIHQRPVLLIGPPGIGKTAIMEQIAAECGIGLVAYTITHHTRQSAIGLPLIDKHTFGDKEYAVTEYTMSEIVASVYQCMEESGCKEGILFIDEINCVSETLAPTMLQFLQCKTFGSHRIPEGWIIVAAGNPPEFNKAVREFDIVTLDRVKRIPVQENYPVWREYACKNKMHPLILAYLDLKPDRFYQIQANAEGYDFVTARGWEDLSRMLYLYEELEIPVTVEFVFEYLQYPETAADFTGFYGLCQKYQKDYRLMDLLKGNLNKEEEQERAENLGQAEFDQQSAVLTLLTEGVHVFAQDYTQLERKTELCWEEARRIRSLLENKEQGCSFGRLLEEEWKNKKHALQVQKEKGLLRLEEAQEKEAVIQWIHEFYYEWKKSSAKPGQEMEELREFFGKDKKKLEEKEREVQMALERAFAFVEAALGKKQETAVFTERISRDPFVTAFIRKCGCPAYEKAGQLLQVQKKSEELKKEIRELSAVLQKKC